MLGPPLGSVVYGQTNFACVFYFFSIWIFIMIFLQMAFIPNSYNYDRESTMKPTKVKDSTIHLNLPSDSMVEKQSRADSTQSIKSKKSNTSSRVASRSGSFALARNKMMELHDSKRNERLLSLLDLEAVDQQASEHTKEEMIRGYMCIGIDDVTIFSTLK